MAKPPRSVHRTPFLLAAALVAGLGSSVAVAQPLERARASLARGDLRAAQIEYRNAVRAEPQNGAVRAGLAAVSLELGDAETAEREARAALGAGYDPPAMTALVIRAQLARERFRDVLRDFPLQENTAQPAVAGQVAAGRALAEFALGDREAARRSVATALRFAPNAVEVRLAAATLALADGNRAASEAEVDQALIASPGAPEALLRKASFLAERSDIAGALETLGRLLAAAPGNVSARVLRAEILMRTGEAARARQDADAALRVMPGSVQATYIIAMLQIQAQDWRAADETLQRMGRVLPNVPDGLLMLATVKRALNQGAQAEDAAQRHFARRPDDPRGAKLLATLQMELDRPDAAAATLSSLAQRGAADAEAYDMLGRAHIAAGRPREALLAFQQAVTLAPNDAAVRIRLAAARLATGDAAGMGQAAGESLALAPDQAGAREMLAVAALARGDITTAQVEFSRLDATQRRSEIANSLDGLLALARFDLPGARTAFETGLRSYPESVGIRLGLARVATAQNNPAEAERLLGEVLRRVPSHPEALGRLVVTIVPNGPRAASALAVLEAAYAATPTDPALAVALAGALTVTGAPARALAVLDTEALRRPGRGAALPIARSQAHAMLNQWTEAEQAARAALSEDPSSFQARRQVMALLLRAENTQGAEALIQEGLRAQPGNPALQQLLVVVVRQTQSLDAALAAADRLAENQAARPASLFLRGDLLMADQRPADAARAFAASTARAPSSALAQREAAAWRQAGQPAQSIAALNAWLTREPQDADVLNMIAQFDIVAGRNADAVRRLTVVAERSPDNAVALNNLAWLLSQRGGAEDQTQARRIAERAYFLMPNVETADTFGWILANAGETQRALVLLRQAVYAPRAPGQAADPDKVFRLAHTLHTAGQREEAIRALEPALASDTAFPERPAAERLLADLRARR